MPVERTRIVRLEMPASALRMVGFPVSEQIAEQQIVADVAVTQDGTPYALKLVRH
jgi:hypothetical protein